MSVWTHGYLFYTLGYNSVLSHLSVSPALAIGSSFSWFLCLSLLHTPMMVMRCFVLFLSTSLLSGIIRCSRLILYTSCPSPKISHFSKESWFLFLENSIRNQDMGAKCAQYYWGVVASSLSADRTRKAMCVYWPLYIHISINISICNHLSLYEAKHEFILMPQTRIHYHMDHSSPLPFLICNLSFP